MIWDTQICWFYVIKDKPHGSLTVKNHDFVLKGLPVRVLLGCVWINDLMREKEMKMKMEKVDDPKISNGWIV